MVLDEIVHKLRRTRSRSDVALVLMDSLRSFIGADCISYFRSDARGITDKESRGLDPLAIRHYLERAKAGLRDPLLAKALCTGQAVQSRDLMTNDDFIDLYRETAKPWAYNQIAASPVVSSADAVSAIQCFRTGNAKPFGEDELRALMSVSMWASVAMTRVEVGNTHDEGPALTPRQREICALLVKGFTNREIAVKLGVSENTIKTHLKEIFARYGVSRRAELAGLLR
jgi:DNA-binding NarL/FixJ family response regulator